jgi:hypothetical protein
MERWKARDQNQMCVPSNITEKLQPLRSSHDLRCLGKEDIIFFEKKVFCRCIAMLNSRKLGWELKLSSATESTIWVRCGTWSSIPSVWTHEERVAGVGKVRLGDKNIMFMAETLSHIASLWLFHILSSNYVTGRSGVRGKAGLNWVSIIFNYFRSL